jgi:hypothetical protein
MKNVLAVVRKVLPAVLLIVGLGYLVAAAQTSKPYNAASAQDQMQQPENEKPAQAKTFAGKILRQGNLLVLSDADGKTIYKLDDQQKAQDFLNKDVKVTGVFDAVSGMIRVTTIEPA